MAGGAGAEQGHRAAMQGFLLFLRELSITAENETGFLSGLPAAANKQNCRSKKRLYIHLYASI